MFPSIYIYWERYQNQLVAKVVHAGDGRHDSMGHSAKYCGYTVFSCFFLGIIRVFHKFLLHLIYCSKSEHSEFSDSEIASELDEELILVNYNVLRQTFPPSNKRKSACFRSCNIKPKIKLNILVRALNGQKYMFTISRGNFVLCLYCTIRLNKYISVCWTRSDFLWAPANTFLFKFPCKTVIVKIQIHF